MGGKRNRKSLEQDLEKVSPPSKMSLRNRSDSKSDEILAKLEAIETRFDSLEKEVAEIKRVLQELEATKNEVAALKETCDGFKRLELDTKRRSILVKGIPFATKEKFENRQQTKAALAGLFGRLGMTPHLVDYHRLGGVKGDEDGTKVPIRVLFTDVDQKLDLFDKLKGKGREMQDVSILTDYPSFQLPEFKKLSNQAFKLRADNPGTRTRIVPKGLGLTLQKRMSATDRWTTVSTR
jgi:hypothetical protein